MNVAFTNTGSVVVETGTLNSAILTNYNSTTKKISGGAFILRGLLKANSLDIVTNESSITLDGTASGMIDQNGASGLRNFASNLVSASFTLTNDRDLTVPGAFTNSGAVTIGVTSIFTTTGNYLQNAGTTSLAAETSRLTATGGTVDIQSGLLEGTGTAGPSVISAGIVSPGLSPGSLSVDGPYGQTSDGLLDIEIAGNAGGTEFDRLIVSGEVTLDGRLRIITDPGFQPAAGASFRIIEHAGSTGEFSEIEGLELPGGAIYRIDYNPTDVTLVVIAPTTLLANPAIAKVLPGAIVYFPNLSATLTESITGDAIAGATIDFYATDSITSETVLVCSAVTDGEGLASCGGALEASSAVLGLGYEARFEGLQDVYHASSDEGSLTSVDDTEPI